MEWALKMLFSKGEVWLASMRVANLVAEKAREELSKGRRSRFGFSNSRVVVKEAFNKVSRQRMAKVGLF